MFPLANIDIQTLLSRMDQLASHGRLDEAMFACAQLIAQNPKHVMGNVMMSRFMYRKGDARGALRYALLAFENVTPQSDWQEILNVSACLDVLADDERARRVFDWLDIENFDDIKTIEHIGAQLSRVGDQDAALRWLSRAAEKGANSESFHHVYASTLTFTGPIQRAYTEMDKVVQINPLHGQGHWALSMMEFADDQRSERIERMQQVIERIPVGDQNAHFLRYGLFREYDKLGETDKAWSYLEQGAQLRKQEVRHDAGAELELFDALIGASKNLLMHENDLTDRLASVPIFVLGMPRTGTTLLERVLGNYAQVQPCGELNVFRGQLQQQTGSVMGFPFDWKFVRNIEKLNVVELGTAYLQNVRWRIKDHAFFTDKHPMNMNFAGLIAAALPNAKIINLMKSPLDACFSNLKEIFGPHYYTYSYSQSDLVTHYKNYRKLMTHWHEIMPGRILDVRYEDLVSFPDEEAERVRAFCGLPYLENVTDITANKHVTTTASTVQMRQPIHKKYLSAWKRYERYLGELVSGLENEEQEYQKGLRTS